MSDTPTHLPLANGLIIDTATGQAMVPSTSPDAVIAQQAKEKKATTKPPRSHPSSNSSVRRGLVDLPADHRAVTTVGVVWLYFTLGVTDAEMAEATGLRISQIEMMKQMQLFSQLDELLKSNLAQLAHADVQQRIDNAAGDALDALEVMLTDEDVKPATRARILMNMLDRGGFAPKQIMEHKHSLEGGLTIRHIKDVARPKDMPTINVKEINNGYRPE
jgi:hypothetical protein